MIRINNFVRDVWQDWIWLDNGRIVIDSRLKDEADELIPFIEDNIVEVNNMSINDGLYEKINWHGVWEDYDKWFDRTLTPKGKGE